MVKTRAVRVRVVLGIICGSVASTQACNSSDDTPVVALDAGNGPTLPTHDASAADTSVRDTSAPDSFVGNDSGKDVQTSIDATPDAVADAGADVAVDAGPLGGATNPATSCKALLSAAPSTASDLYWISPTGLIADAFSTYCDMTTEGGGWTKVTSATPDAWVQTLLGGAGRQMIKCTESGTDYVASPSFTLDLGDAGADGGVDGSVPWSWDAGRFVQVGGTWRVNQADQSCGTNPEYTTVVCNTWWGVGCGNGGGNTNKLFPGVLDSPSSGFCADTTSGHTNATFSICGNNNNYRTYSVFVRAD